MTENKPKLLDQVTQVIRIKHYSLRTEESYINWIKRFICFQLQKYQPTQDQEFKKDTICMTLLFKRQLSKQLEMRVLPNMQVVILSDILLQLIFLNQVTDIKTIQ